MAWEQLLGYVQEAAEYDREDAAATPTECPHDYFPLTEGPNGKLFCRWDGTTWPDDAAAWGPYPGQYR